MSPNRELLETMARRLEPLLSDMVFVGGATTELFFTDPTPPRVRPTTDVDVICEVQGRTGYFRLSEELRNLGFREDMRAGAPICRWISKGGVLVVMPTDERILGFSNPWYEYGIKTATPQVISDDLTIRLVTPSIFVATKIAAYYGRGEGDLLASRDIEDIVSVIAARKELVDKIANAPPDLRRWIAERIKQTFVSDPLGRAAIDANLPDARIIPELATRTAARIGAMAELD